MIVELMGIVAAVLAVVGVLANNRRYRWCFGLWAISNLVSAGIHAIVGIWSLLGRDIVFFVLAAEGWVLWGKVESKRLNKAKNGVNGDTDTT